MEINNGTRAIFCSKRYVLNIASMIRRIVFTSVAPLFIHEHLPLITDIQAFLHERRKSVEIFKMGAKISLIIFKCLPYFFIKLGNKLFEYHPSSHSSAHMFPAIPDFLQTKNIGVCMALKKIEQMA